MIISLGKAAGHPAQRLERIPQRLGQGNHFRPALFDLLCTHCESHEFKRTAEIVLGVLKIHCVHEHARARAPQQCQSRLLHQADVDLVLPQRFQQIDAHGREMDFLGVGTGLLQQIERERVISITKRGDADRPSLQILDRWYLARGLGSGDNGEQGEAAGDRKAADVRADIGIGLERDVQRGGCIFDRASDQRLHGGIAAAGVDQLHLEPMSLEIAGRARDFVRHPAQKLAAVGEPDLLALRFGAGGSGRRDDACNQSRPLEQRASRHVGVGHAGGGFIAAAHGSLQISLRGALQTLEIRWRDTRGVLLLVAAIVGRTLIPGSCSSDDAVRTIRLRKEMSNA